MLSKIYVVSRSLTIRNQLGMAFFFCDYKKPETQTASTILGSLVKQFALQDERCLLDLESFYETHNPKGKPPQEITDTELCAVLRAMALHFKNCMILIDGLDEIESKRAEILELLLSLTSAGNIKTLFASRDEVDIRSSLSEYASISIAARSGDLRLYVAAEIETRTTRNQLRIQDPKLKEHIMKTLITGAEGMYAPRISPSFSRANLPQVSVGGLPNGLPLRVE
jgi:hypothetical protein